MSNSFNILRSLLCFVTVHCIYIYIYIHSNVTHLINDGNSSDILEVAYPHLSYMSQNVLLKLLSTDFYTL